VPQDALDENIDMSQANKWPDATNIALLKGVRKLGVLESFEHVTPPD
jgi:hypothetical protein